MLGLAIVFPLFSKVNSIVTLIFGSIGLGMMMATIDSSTVPMMSDLVKEVKGPSFLFLLLSNIWLHVGYTLGPLLGAALFSQLSFTELLLGIACILVILGPLLTTISPLLSSSSFESESQSLLNKHILIQ